MHSELYTDGISEITVSGSVVRVDLVSLSPTERDANNNPTKVFRQRLIFSTEAFANSVELMQKALQGLAEAGVVKRVQPRAPEAKSDSSCERACCFTVGRYAASTKCLSKFPVTRKLFA